ncbi:MAG: GntR family transcriptional regulator [Pseudomonadota bacterium]
MDARGSLPKHMQISELLVREIAAGRLADGARLPGEREMAQGMGVAVGTLRRALDDLTERGLLERVQGSGNYVRQSVDARSVYAFFRLERPEGGGLPTAEVISAEAVPRPEHLPTETHEARVLRVRRLRRLDGVAAALEEIWLDAPGAAGLARQELSESLYLTYQERLGIAIARTEDRVGTGTLPDWGALGPAPGSIVGHVARRGWAGGRVVEASETWFDSEAARFVSRTR